MLRSFPRFGGSKKDLYKDSKSTPKHAQCVQQEYTPPPPSNPPAHFSGREWETSVHQASRRTPHRRPVAPSGVHGASSLEHSCAQLPSQAASFGDGPWPAHEEAANLQLHSRSQISTAHRSPGDTSPQGSESSKLSATTSSLLSSTETRPSEELVDLRKGEATHSLQHAAYGNRGKSKGSGDAAARAAAAYMSRLDPSILSANSCSWQIPGMGWAKADGRSSTRVAKPQSVAGLSAHGVGTLAQPVDDSKPFATEQPDRGAYSMHAASAAASGEQKIQSLHLQTKLEEKRTECPSPVQRASSGRTREEAPSSPTPSSKNVNPWNTSRQMPSGPGMLSIEAHTSHAAARCNSPRTRGSPSRSWTGNEVVGSEEEAPGEARPAGVEWLLSARENLRKVKSPQAQEETGVQRGAAQRRLWAASEFGTGRELQAQPDRPRNLCSRDGEAKIQGDAWAGTCGEGWKGEEPVMVCDAEAVDGPVGVEGLQDSEDDAEDDAEEGGSFIAGLQQTGSDDEEGEVVPASASALGAALGAAEGVGEACGAGDEQYGVSQALLDATFALAPGRALASTHSPLLP